MEHKHIPHKEIGSFTDAWMGSRRIGRDEDGDKMYEDIVCRVCNVHIKANKDLTGWILYE